MHGHILMSKVLEKSNRSPAVVVNVRENVNNNSKNIKVMFLDFKENVKT